MRVSHPLPWVALILGLGLAVAPLGAQEGIRSFGRAAETERVVFRDSKGVETLAVDFRKVFGLPVLNAFRGDSEVEIPFERIKALTTGPVVEHRMEVRLILVNGREMSVKLAPPEFETIYAGQAEWGSFRIRLEDIAGLEFFRPEYSGERPGLRCANGHVYFEEDWKYCPYDGHRLMPVPVPEPEEGESTSR